MNVSVIAKPLIRHRIPIGKDCACFPLVSDLDSHSAMRWVDTAMSYFAIALRSGNKQAEAMLSGKAPSFIKRDLRRRPPKGEIVRTRVNVTTGNLAYPYVKDMDEDDYRNWVYIALDFTTACLLAKPSTVSEASEVEAKEAGAKEGLSPAKTRLTSAGGRSITKASDLGEDKGSLLDMLSNPGRWVKA